MWLEVSPWLRKFYMLRVWPKKKKDSASFPEQPRAPQGRPGALAGVSYRLGFGR